MYLDKKKNDCLKLGRILKVLGNLEEEAMENAGVGGPHACMGPSLRYSDKSSKFRALSLRVSLLWTRLRLLPWHMPQ